VVSSNSRAGHQNLLLQKKILHRDISIGNVLITEDESEGFLIDLDHATRVDREETPGAEGRTGTKVFMSIGLLLQNDDQSRQPDVLGSFLDMRPLFRSQRQIGEINGVQGMEFSFSEKTCW